MTRKVDLLVVHVSATPPSWDKGAAAIREMHRKLGWFDIGYNWVIRRDGVVEPGRSEDQVPAHIGDSGPGMNARSIGVCLVGGVDEQGKPAANATPAQLKALKPLLADIQRRYAILPGNIMGHHDVIRLARAGHWGKVVMAPPKACPCFDTQHWLETGEYVASFA